MILADSIHRILMAYLKPSNKNTGILTPVLMQIKKLKIREERHFLKEKVRQNFGLNFISKLT